MEQKLAYMEAKRRDVGLQIKYFLEIFVLK